MPHRRRQPTNALAASAAAERGARGAPERTNARRTTLPGAHAASRAQQLNARRVAALERSLASHPGDVRPSPSHASAVTPRARHAIPTGNSSAASKDDGGAEGAAASAAIAADAGARAEMESVTGGGAQRRTIYPWPAGTRRGVTDMWTPYPSLAYHLKERNNPCARSGRVQSAPRSHRASGAQPQCCEDVLCTVA